MAKSVTKNPPYIIMDLTGEEQGRVRKLEDAAVLLKRHGVNSSVWRLKDLIYIYGHTIPKTSPHSQIDSFEWATFKVALRNLKYVDIPVYTPKCFRCNTQKARDIIQFRDYEITNRKFKIPICEACSSKTKIVVRRSHNGM